MRKPLERLWIGSQPRRQHGLLIVAVRRADGALVFNPDIDIRFQSSDGVIAMGRADDLERFREEYGM